MNSSPEINRPNLFTHISVQKNITDKNGQFFEAVGKLNGKEVRIYCKTNERLDPGKIEEILGNAFVSKITRGKENRNTAELKSNKLKINILFSDPETYNELKQIKDKKISLNQQLKKTHPLDSIKKSVGDAYAKVYNAVHDLKSQLKTDKTSSYNSLEEYKIPEGENYGEIPYSEFASIQSRRQGEKQLKILNTFLDQKGARNYKKASLDFNPKTGDFIFVSKKVDKERDKRVAAAIIDFLTHKTNADFLVYEDLKDRDLPYAAAHERFVANRLALRALASNTNQPFHSIIRDDPRMSEKLRDLDGFIMLNT